MTWLMEIVKIQQEEQLLINKEINLARNPKYDGYQRGLASIIYKFFDKRSAGSGVNRHENNKIKQNQQPLDLATSKLPDELQKPIIKKFLERKVYS